MHAEIENQAMPAKKITFHIGIQKTGSGFLQHHVFPNFHGINYYNAVRPLREVVLGIDPSQPVLISNERLSGKLFTHPEQPDLTFARQQAIARLAHLFPGAQILVLVREPSAWIGSTYGQYLMSGGRLPFADFVDNALEKNWLDFAGFLSAAKSAGFSKVMAFDYDDLLNHRQTVIERMAGFVGASAINMQQVNMRAVYHPSPKRNAARLLRLVNQACKSDLYDRGLPLYSDLAYKLRLTPRHILRTRMFHMLHASGSAFPEQSLLTDLRARFSEQWAAVRREFLEPVAADASAGI